MDNWNYRIMKHKDGTYGLHEVTYKNGEPVLWSENPIAGYYEELGDLIRAFEMMLSDIQKDTSERSILDEKALMDKFEG